MSINLALGGEAELSFAAHLSRAGSLKAKSRTHTHAWVERKTTTPTLVANSNAFRRKQALASYPRPAVDCRRVRGWFSYSPICLFNNGAESRFCFPFVKLVLLVFASRRFRPSQIHTSPPAAVANESELFIEFASRHLNFISFFCQRSDNMGTWLKNSSSQRLFFTGLRFEDYELVLLVGLGSVGPCQARRRDTYLNQGVRALCVQCVIVAGRRVLHNSIVHASILSVGAAKNGPGASLFICPRPALWGNFAKE